MHTEMHNHDFRVLQQNAEDSSKACLLQPVDQMEVWHERSVNKNNFLCENNWKVKMWILHLGVTMFVGFLRLGCEWILDGGLTDCPPSTCWIS